VRGAAVGYLLAALRRGSEGEVVLVRFGVRGRSEEWRGGVKEERGGFVVVCVGAFISRLDFKAELRTWEN
jgi:hypothetical protein